MFTSCLVRVEAEAFVNLNPFNLVFLFADQTGCNGRPVCVPQQPPARRRSGRLRRAEAGTAERRQVWVAQEARRVCQDLAQSLVCAARGPALLLQGRGGDQSSGKTVITQDECQLN